MKELAVFLFVLCIFGCNAEDKDICRLFKDGTYLRKPGSCDEYIICQNGISDIKACASGKLYDRTKQACVDASTLSSDTYCKGRCVGKNNVWVPDQKSCEGFYYCRNGESIYSYCSKGYQFDEKLQMCVHDADSNCVDVGDICQITPKEISFRNENDCGKYYKCKSDTLSTPTCSKKYFDVETGGCVDMNSIKCTAHPLKANLCGKVGSPTKLDFVADQATCRGFYRCAKLGDVPDVDPIWGQCPAGTFFDEAQQSCRDPKDVACIYNRCDGRTDGYVESKDNDCHNYLVCKDGFQVEERTCFGNQFFDPTMGVCSKKIIEDPSCDYCLQNPKKCK